MEQGCWSGNQTFYSAESTAVHALQGWRNGRIVDKIEGLGCERGVNWAGDKLLFTGPPTHVHSWLPESLEIQPLFERAQSQPFLVALAPDSGTLAIAHQVDGKRDTTVRVINLKTGKKLLGFPEVFRYDRLSFSASGDHLAVGAFAGWKKRELYVVGRKQGRSTQPIPTQGTEHGIQPLDWRGETPFFVTPGLVVEGRNPQLRELGERIKVSALSPPIKNISIAAENGKMAISGDGPTIELFDREGATLGKIDVDHALVNYVTHLAIRPQGDFLAAYLGEDRGELQLVDIRQEPVATSIRRPLNAGVRLSWSPNGKFLVTRGKLRSELVTRVFSFPDLMPYVSLHALPGGETAIVSPAGEIVFDSGAARQYLHCSVEENDGTYSLYTYEQFHKKYGAAIAKRPPAVDPVDSGAKPEVKPQP